MPAAVTSPTRSPRPEATSAGRWSRRLPAILVAAAAAGLLGIAAVLPPADAGLGTHTGLGLPPCGFYSTTRLPCATCGMTTAFAHAARGQLVTSFQTQPAGAILALLSAVALLVGGWASLTGASLAPIGRRLWRPAVIWTAGGLFGLAWAWKVLLTIGSTVT